MTRTLLLGALLAIAATARAQAPAANWRTLSTRHFHVHYPQPYEPWARRAASRLESIREAVIREVGFDPQQTIDVIVTNPDARANGLAFPLLDAPRIVLYAEPPGPEEQIGGYHDWIDLLATHEVAHVVHMLRPSRNPLQRLIERLILPLDPIAFGPRWMLEGYATVIEGRLTGSGRPPGTLRALILRQWAANGQLPSYGQLNADSRFLGQSMAYLTGSAFLEWLEQRSEPGSLQRLWSRMTAVQRRSFSAAFAGVFGDRPERLYGQFVAELTSSALAVNRSGPLREGELWQETPRASGDPAISRDGSRMVIVMRPRHEPARLVVWSTGPPEKERAEFDARLAAERRGDPDDPPPLISKPLPRKVLHSFQPPDGGDIDTPRWTADGSVLYSHRQPDRQGFRHRDLFLWSPDSGTHRRVTKLADVFDADPIPGGQWAVAVRSRHGQSQLVRVDLGTGGVRALTGSSLETVYSHPRLSPDGSRIVYSANRDGVWSLQLRSLATGEERSLPGGTDMIAPAWDGEDIIATRLSGGFAELHRLQPDGRSLPLTRSPGGAFWPAPSPDGRVFFMGLDPDGFVVRVIDGKSQASPVPAYDPRLVPALPPEMAVPPPFVSAAVAPTRPYGAGRQETSWLLGQIVAPGQRATEIGLRTGDIVGRLDTIFIVSLGAGNAQRGAGLASVWQRWPVALAGSLFYADDHHLRRRGLELRGSWKGFWPRLRLNAEGGGMMGSPFRLAFAGAGISADRVFSSWKAEQEVQMRGETGSVRHLRGVARGSLRRGQFAVAITIRHDQALGGAVIDVGGVPSSVLPSSAHPQRVLDPSLPVRTLRGRRYDGVRIETSLPGLPARLFYQRHKTGSGSLGLAGLEVALNAAAVPLIRYPALDLTAGAARTLDGPLPRDIRFWLATRWRP